MTPNLIRNLPAAALLLLLSPATPTRAQAPPDPFLAHVQAGQTALHAGLPLVAAREYRIAVRLHPRDADAHYTLAGVLEAAGRADEAMAEYRQTLTLRPDSAPAHNALAGLLEDRGETAAALAHYYQAVTLLPSDPRLHFNLGAVLAETGRAADAAAQYREALRLNPDFTEAAQALRALAPRPPIRGEAEKDRKAHTPAAHRALLPPPSTVAGDGGLSHALTLARAGRLVEAIAAFRALLAHDPHNAAARLHLGIALYADGRAGPARRAWDEVQAMGDSGTAAQAARLLARYH